jgi:hypothetical protein
MTRTQVTRSGILDVLVEHRGREVAVRHAPAALVQWVTFTHLPIAMLALFLALTCILVIAFLGYHVHLLLSNETTNEARAGLRKVSSSGSCLPS